MSKYGVGAALAVHQLSLCFALREVTCFVTVTSAATIQVDTDDALPVWACVCVCLTTRVSAGHVIKQIGCC